MKYVYVVTTGCYSDYSIRGVFSTKEKAQQFIKNCLAADACWDRDFNDITEWTLNSELSQKTYTLFSCGIMLDDGSILEKETWSREYFGIPESTVNLAESVPFYDGRGIVRAESCKSAKHAYKLAVEARQKWLRTKDKIK